MQPPKSENETPVENVSDEEKKKQEAERRRKFEEKLKQDQYQRDDM